MLLTLLRVSSSSPLQAAHPVYAPPPRRSGASSPGAPAHCHGRGGPRAARLCTRRLLRQSPGFANLRGRDDGARLLGCSPSRLIRRRLLFARVLLPAGPACERMSLPPHWQSWQRPFPYVRMFLPPHSLHVCFSLPCVQECHCNTSPRTLTPAAKSNTPKNADK